MSEHTTTGPWRMEFEHPTPDYGHPYMRLNAGNGIGDQDGNGGFHLSGIVGQADARLIAAAPEMLHALEMVRDANRDEPHIPSIALATIEAAIAKATGK